MQYSKTLSNRDRQSTTIHLHCAYSISLLPQHVLKPSITRKITYIDTQKKISFHIGKKKLYKTTMSSSTKKKKIKRFLQTNKTLYSTFSNRIFPHQ